MTTDNDGHELIQIPIPFILDRAAAWMREHGYPSCATTIEAERARVEQEAALIAQLDADLPPDPDTPSPPPSPHEDFPTDPSAWNYHG